VDTIETLIAVPFDTTQITHASNRSNPQLGDPCHPLASGAHPPLIAFTIKDHGSDIGQGVSPTLRSMAHAGSHANGGGQIAIAFQSRIARNGRGQPEEICPTLNGADAGATSDMRPMAAIPTVNGWTVRKLTPRECERLQGFPDDFTAIRWRGKLASDGPRYKAIGNSMAVNVMRWIGVRIALVEQATEQAARRGQS
jgi:DNA (cytosine-5)-methyltransferase 1